MTTLDVYAAVNARGPGHPGTRAWLVGKGLLSEVLKGRKWPAKTVFNWLVLEHGYPFSYPTLARFLRDAFEFGKF